ncbi:MAG TPA: UdgX family uracil-DNA binding protein [Acidimicrobiales bacterium]
MTAHEGDLPALDADGLAVVAEEAAGCTRCDLWRDATRTVFGEGPVPSPLLLVGEQPGDKEDEAGRPFVGPAGRILDEALELAGLERAALYVTNAVKHFKWKPRGKRRIHQRPATGEVVACAHWLDREVAAARPAVIVAMGATAVRSLFGAPGTIRELRGEVQESRYGIPTVVTVHPAAVVRLRERDERRAELEALAADLRLAARHAGATG